MARTVAEIQAEIIAYKEAQADLAGLTSTSHRAIWILWTFVVASAIAIFEQLQDLYLATVEAVVARSAGASFLWVQDKFFKFQYSATDPQVIQLIDTVPQYPVVNEALRIITACSVTSSVSNEVNIKVAKEDPYTALSGPELSAAQSMIDTIGVAGIIYNVISLAADKIYINANVYYKGQYSSVIEDLVITALNNYLQTLSKINFNGEIKMSDLEGVIRVVEGVNDVVMLNVKGRADAVVFASGTYFIQNSTLVTRLWNPAAGYIVQEDTAGQTFADSLNFISQ